MLGRLLGALTGGGVGGGYYGGSRQDWGYGRGYSGGRDYAGSFGGQLPSWADGFLSQSRGVGESATAISQALGAVRSLFGSGGGPSWGPSGGSVFDRYRSGPGFPTSPDLGYFLRNRDSVNRVGGIIDQIGRLSPQDRQLLWYGLRSPQAGYYGPSQGAPSPLGLVGDVQGDAPRILPQLAQGRGPSGWVAVNDGLYQVPQRLAPRVNTYAGGPQGPAALTAYFRSTPLTSLFSLNQG